MLILRQLAPWSFQRIGEAQKNEWKHVRGKAVSQKGLYWVALDTYNLPLLAHKNTKQRMYPSILGVCR